MVWEEFEDWKNDCYKSIEIYRQAKDPHDKAWKEKRQALEDKIKQVLEAPEREWLDLESQRLQKEAQERPKTTEDLLKETGIL